MLLRLALSAALLMTTAAAASEDADGPTAPPDLIDKPWSEVRPRLIQLGYRPVPLVQPADEATCEASPEYCRQWPELMSCSGSGHGYCSFLYRLPKSGRLFQVVTWGDKPVALAGFGWLPPGVLKGVKFR
jgi:hypothetical protein